MSDRKIDTNDIGAFIAEQVERNGVSVSTVSDGTVLTFKTSWLRNLLEQHGKNETICLFVKRPDFKN